MSEFHHGHKITFISEDAIKETEKVSIFSFFFSDMTGQKIMGSDSILFWSE